MQEKRIKAWTDRGYRTIGPSAGAAIGAGLGTVAPGIGNVIGGVAGGAIGAVGGGRIIHKTAMNYGIPAQKALKRAKEASKEEKQIKKEKRKEKIEVAVANGEVARDEYGRGLKSASEFKVASSKIPSPVSNNKQGKVSGGKTKIDLSDQVALRKQRITRVLGDSSKKVTHTKQTCPGL